MTTLVERGTTPEVLVIEDNQGDAILLRLAFKASQMPANITIAPNAEVGMNALRHKGGYENYERPDIILLDLNLTKMHGLTFLSEVKNDPDLAGIPVIVLSSSAAEKDVSASYAAHANGYLTKPNSLEGYNSLVNGISNYWFHQVHMPVQ